MPDAATKKKPDAEPRPVEGPPEEEFWEKYNRRLEFPLSSVMAVLVHVLVACLIVILLNEWAKKPSQPMNIGDGEINGLDDFGMGSAGSGGVTDPLVERMNVDPATAAIESLADPTKLPEIKEKMQQTIKLIDPTGNLPITSANAVAYEGLDKAVRDKLLGAQTGAGNQAGKGFDGSKGSGPGGTGADSTLGRNMRWTLRFKVSSGRNYLDQLQAMGAKILIPMPGSDKCLLIRDLANPDDRRVVSPDELGEYGGFIKFWDSRRDAVGGVARTLGLDFSPKSFCALFSKDFEEELRRKEMNFRNRREEDIEETVFRVSVVGGRYEVVVDEQTVRRR